MVSIKIDTALWPNLVTKKVNPSRADGTLNFRGFPNPKIPFQPRITRIKPILSWQFGVLELMEEYRVTLLPS
jgi:hypothetical protein